MVGCWITWVRLVILCIKLLGAHQSKSIMLEAITGLTTISSTSVNMNGPIPLDTARLRLDVHMADG